MNSSTSNFTQVFSPRNLISQRTMKKQQNQDSSLNIFMASIQRQNLTDFQQTKQNLFFKKDLYLKSVNKKKPFNHPSNLREILKYQPLKIEDLKKIQILQKVLDFGHIFIGSKSVKKLTVTNNLDQPIIFQLDTQNYRCLSQNNSQAVKIQGFAIYQVEIILNPTQIGQIQLPLTYVINRQHLFEIKVTALITLINLQLSSRSFTFTLTQQQHIFQKQQTLRVYNHGNKKTKFFFQQPQNRSFKLDILQGQIQPKSNLDVKIIYYPYFGNQSGQERLDTEKLKLKVDGGAQNIIKLNGTVRQPKLLIKQTQFNYQRSFVSIPIINRITLKNLSRFSAYGKIYFQSLNPSMTAEQVSSYFTIDKLLFEILGQDKKDINFTFLCHQLKYINCNIVLQIRGYKIIKIPFIVAIIYPQIQASTSSINFEDISIMSNCCFQTFSLINKTGTDVKLQIDQYSKEQYILKLFLSKKNSYKQLEKTRNYQRFQVLLPT